MSGSNGHVKSGDLAGMARIAVRKDTAGHAVRDRIAKAGGGQAAIDQLAREVIALNERIVAKEVEFGIRKSAPIRKAGLSLGGQLREIIEEIGLRKSATNDDDGPSWREVM